MQCSNPSHERAAPAGWPQACILALGERYPGFGSDSPDEIAAPLSLRHCHDFPTLLASLRSHKPDLVLLNDDGCVAPPLSAVIASIRAEADIPCVLRSARMDREQDRIAALDAGYDDCIGHTVSDDETLARIRAVLRRTLRHRPAATASVPSRAWRISPERRELYAPDGTACGLTSAEFDLLHTLAKHRGAVVSREVLSQAVFRRAWYPQDRGIDNLTARLRRKLAALSRNSQVVKPVRGVGYAFTGF